jgi:hypothetical protein
MGIHGKGWILNVAVQFCLAKVTILCQEFYSTSQVLMFRFPVYVVNFVKEADCNLEKHRLLLETANIAAFQYVTFIAARYKSGPIW